jgi:hypothetical protein
MHTTNVVPNPALCFEVDGRKVSAVQLDAEGNGPFAVKFKWMEHQLDLAPLQYLTRDDGQTFYQFETSIAAPSGHPRTAITKQETDPTRLTQLQGIWCAYLLELSRERHSPSA